MSFLKYSGLLLIFLILAELSTPVYGVVLVNPGITEDLVNYYSSIIDSYLVDGMPLKDLFVEINQTISTNPDQALSLLDEALRLDSDRDGLPDYIELIDNLSPFDGRSAGEYDLLYYVASGPVIDGYLIEWQYISHNTMEVSSSDPYSDLPGTWVVKAYMVRDQKYVYLGLEVDDPPLAPTIVNYTVKLVDSDYSVTYDPVNIAYYYDGLEAVFKIPRGNNLRVEITLLTSKGSKEYSFSIKKIDIKSVFYGDYSVVDSIYPMKYWYTVIPDNLPWYPLLVFGDNRPGDMGSVKFDPPFYRLLYDLRIYNPEAAIGTGDHVGLGRRDQIEEFLKVMAGVENPWTVTGNHDWSYLEHADREYWETMVIPNLMIRDDIPGWRIIFINGYALEASDIDMSKIKHPIKKQDLINAITSAGDRSVILVFHVPPLDTGYGYPTVFSYQQMEFLRSLIKDYAGKVKLVLCGHWHVWRRETYFGVDLVITGGGGAPLSSSGGLPVYHYTALILYPDGTYELWPVKTYSGYIRVYMERINSTFYEYVVFNNKTDVYDHGVEIPLRIPISISGIEYRLYLRASRGETHVYVSRKGSQLVIRVDGSSKWFVYGVGETYTPIDNTVTINLPSLPDQLPTIQYSLDDKEKEIIVETSNVEASVSLVVSDKSLSYSSPLMLVSGVLKSYIPVFEDGEYSITFYYVGFDRVVKTSISVPADFYPPKIEVLKLPESTSKDFTFTVEVRDLSLKWVALYIDTSKLFNETVSNTVFTRDVYVNVSEYSEGVHYVRVLAGDEHGHTSTYDVSFTIDYTSPQISVFLPDHLIEGEYYTMHVDVTDLSFDYFEVYVNGTFKAMYKESSVDVPLSILDIVLAGKYNITIVAYDKAGNKAVYTKMITIEKPTHTKYSKTTTTTTSKSPTASETLSSTNTVTAGGYSEETLWVIIALIIIAIAIVVSIFTVRKHS